MHALKSTVKWIFRAVAPNRYAAWFAARANRHGRSVLVNLGMPDLVRAWTSRHGWVVIGGPFAGTRYIEQAAGSAILPKLIGTYEHELHEALEEILRARYAAVVDIGSAEGYYAVGLALRLPGAPVVHAFDADPDAQRLCRELAALNGVSERVVVGGICDGRTLARLTCERSLVVCDCEGCELELIDPQRVPSLRTADLLVELHEDAAHGITETLRNRFTETHDVRLIEQELRDPDSIPQLAFMSPGQRELAVSEFRVGRQRWAFLRARGG
jgi:hypothetical protein